MKKLTGFAVLVLLLGLILAMSPSAHALSDDAAQPSQASTSDDSQECTLPLRATVRQGPDAGLDLFGLAHMNIDRYGSTEGSYEIVAPEEYTGEVPLVGQITGRAVNLKISLSNETSIFGVGTSDDPIGKTCHTEWGGPFVGPGEGDSGDWLCTPDRCCGGGVCKCCQLIGSRNVCIDCL